MTSDHIAKIREIFLHAQELPPEQRKAYLDDVCAAEPELKAEVLSLLQADQNGGPLAQPLLSNEALLKAAMESSAPQPRAGKLGNYDIKERIGHGGMGDVYQAEQKNPKRLVALKLLRSGLISRERGRRLETEAQALGKLNHPAIAHIYEAGADNDEPFFAMEFIQGQELDKYADVHQLSIEQRLGLIARICDGVQHAHQRGIIHRDLKPSNILVDQTGQPKILDFGIARSLQADFELTQTVPGSVIGTPAYMSPEQARGDSASIGTPCDVYSLGVCAYRLLTGRLPYAIEGKDFVQALKIIADPESQPQRPGAIDRRLRGDIETILLKAMAKEQAMRYTSAGELALDIRRYLSHQTIFARPQSTWYQIARFTRRHRALVGMLALTVLILIAGIITTTVWAIRARQAESDKSIALDQVRLQLGELASARGEWPTAVDAYRKALDAGTGNPIETRIRLIRAMYSTDDRIGARRELDALVAQYPQSAQRADVLFWKGSSAWLTDSDQAATLFKQAMAAKEGTRLAPADREYVLGLLADDLQQSAEHFRAALAEDRFMYDCYPSLVGTLLLLGQMDEALAVCHDWQLAYPKDAMTGVARSAIYAIQRKDAESAKAFAEVKNRLEPATRQRMETVLDIVKNIEAVDPETASYTEALALGSKVLSLIDEGSSGGDSRLTEIRFPQATRKLMAAGVKLVKTNMNPFSMLDPTAEERQFQALQEVADLLPIAQANLKVGQYYALKNNFDRAEHYLRRAVSMPSLLDFSRSKTEACVWLMQAQSMIINKMALDKAPRRQIDRAIVDFQQTIVWPLINQKAILVASHGDRLTLMNNCISMGLEGEARTMLAQWLEESAKKSEPSGQLARARIELRLGNYSQALIAAEEALAIAVKQKPQIPASIAQIKKVRQEAIDKIGKVGPPYAAQSLEEFLKLHPAH